MSTPITVANAVVASLNEAVFSPEFEAARHYQPDFDLMDLKTLRISVVPKSVEIERSERASFDYDCAIDIAVQQKVVPGDTATLDSLMQLVEDIADHLLASAVGDAWPLGAENAPIFDPEMLHDKHVFLSLLTVTYRVGR